MAQSIYMVETIQLFNEKFKQGLDYSFFSQFPILILIYQKIFILYLLNFFDFQSKLLQGHYN